MISGMPPEKSSKLPELRKGITFAFGDYDTEGKPQWLIHDGGRNKFFILGWIEYELLQRWHLGDAEELVDAVNEETTLHVDLNDVENLLRFLSHNYLIKQSGYQIYQRAKDQKLFKNDNLLHWLISYYLFFKIPIIHPDRFLEKTKKISDFIFSRYLGWVMGALAVVAVYQISTQWDKFVHTFPTIFTIQGLFFYLIAYSICKFCHELGHAYMCRSFGIPVPTLGLAFLVFWPVLYTDTTLSWSLNSKQRMRIALAGIWVETYVTIIAALIWCNADNLTIQAICYVTITVNWMASLLINVSPFMRFDGYYILADLIKMPNLQPRAFALTRWQIRRWLFKWPEAPPEKFPRGKHNFLVAYSITTWIYRLSIYLGIALLVYHFVIKIVGIVLFAVEVFYFILGPFVNEIQFWIVNRAKITLNNRSAIFLTILFILFLFFFLPFNSSVEIPATLSYEHLFLISPEDGILETPIPPKGTLIQANQQIIKIKSPDLNHAIQQVILEYNKKVNELRRSSIDIKEEYKKNILLSDINKDQAKYKKLMSVYNKFSLHVPFNGIIAETASEIMPGTFVMKNEWLADVVNPKVVQGEGFVTQFDFNSLKKGMSGYFYPTDLSEPATLVKINSIEVLNASQLNCSYSGDLSQDKNEEKVVDSPCYNASVLGGDIASLITDDGQYVPIDSVFRVGLSPIKPVQLNHIQRGTVVFKTKPTSYAYWVFNKLKTILIEQSGF